MRLSLRLLGCSVATLVAIGCSGTTVSHGGLQAAGSAGVATTTAGGYSTASVAGQANGGAGASSATSGASAGGSMAAGGAASGGSSNVTVPNGGQSAVGGSSTGATGPVTSSVGGFGAGGSSTVVDTAVAGAAPTGGVAATGGTSATVAPPSVTSVSPASGTVETTLAIAGKNFGATQGASTVKIAGSTVTPGYWSDTSIEVTIPRALLPGSTSIVVTIGTAQPITSTFEVVLPRTIYVNPAAQPTNAIAAFSLAANDVITELPGSPFSAGDESRAPSASDATALAFNRATRRLFALNYASIRVFDIDPVTGQLTAIGTTPVNSDATFGSGIAVNAAGTLVYATSVYAANGTTPQPTVSAFQVSAGGYLTRVANSPYTHTGIGSGSPALLNGDQFLVVNNKRDMGPDFNSLFVYRVDPTTGALTVVDGSPFQASPTGIIAYSSHVDPSGTRYYMADTLNTQLAAFTFLSTGKPVALAGTPVAMSMATGERPSGIAFSLDGTRMYVGSYDGNQLSGFSLDAGVPTPLAGSPFTIGGKSAITNLALTRSGSQLVLADGINSTLSAHTLSAAGVPNTGNGNSFPSVGMAMGMVIAE